MSNYIRRVAVTGMGVIHALGTDPESFWDSVVSGKSGIKALESDEFARFPTRIASFIENFPEDRYLRPKETRSWDRFDRFAVWAALQAWENADAASADVDAEKIGVWIGTGMGGIETLLKAQEAITQKDGWRSSPFTIPMMIGNMAAGLVSMKTGARGPSIAPVSACATANNAIGEAFLAIRSGRLEIAVAGGAEAPILPVSFSGFNSMQAMSTRNENPAAACAPFSADRDGFVMGEGAGILVLEEWESARKRKARILAEITGYGSTSDAYHLTAPDPEGRGGAEAMRLAAKMSEWERGSISYINAHGTGTPVGDIAETKAVKRFFGKDTNIPPVSSTKAATGHLFGAAGGIEAIISIQAIRHGIIPPTLNLHHRDSECDLDYVPLKACKAGVNRVLSNGLGFGGHNAVLAFEKADDL